VKEFDEMGGGRAEIGRESMGIEGRSIKKAINRVHEVL